MEDFTRDDMELYVLGYSKECISDFRENKDAWEGLAKELSVKAEGIWLWTTLVVKSILGRVRRGEGLGTALSILKEYPQGLDALYGRIMNFPVYAADVRFFLVGLADPIEAAANDWNRAPKDTDLDELPVIRNRLHNRCKDFLEIFAPNHVDHELIKKSYPENHVYWARVTFVHRSARDFLEAEHKTALRQHAGEGFSSRLGGMAMMIASLKFNEYSASSFGNNFDHVGTRRVMYEWLNGKVENFFRCASTIDDILRTELSTLTGTANPTNGRVGTTDVRRLGKFFYNHSSTTGRMVEQYLKLIHQLEELLFSPKRAHWSEDRRPHVID
ncbi:hypothetical protein BJ508DRAFT_336269 [Ascobolus immersus RN42]|uniref:DUF7791 domain-containing protein n=1 Tax=Ascobolus immersus RN42 TaxID=1160509 RepID=A0A3N4HD72_ASCIM|nr:hypothetical protein BJ508DRAFT_336269 [Ascobolus immersus RN42]